MPLIKPEAISYLEKFMKTNSSEMGTLASKLNEKDGVILMSLKLRPSKS